jgi:hypothetical protein
LIRLPPNNVALTTGLRRLTRSTVTGALPTVTTSESVKAACQGANPWPGLATIPWHLLHNTMLIYKPEFDNLHRVIWNGGDSPMLHFQKIKDGEWKDLDSMTFMSGIPTGTKELYYEMREYYNYSMTMLQDIMYAVAF